MGALFPLDGSASPGPGGLRDCEYVVVDVETTGGSIRAGHRIIDVGAVCMDGRGRVVDEFHTLVNPERPIPRFVSALTNITDAMTAAAPRFDEIVPELARRFEGRVFVAHNARFDYGFVGAEMVLTSGFVLESRVLCTLRMSRKLVPEVHRRSLDALCYFFGIENEARHRAFGDARVTASILARLLDRLEEREVNTLDALDTYLRGRRPRRKRSALPQPMEVIEWA